MTLKKAVEEAINSIKSAFPDNGVVVVEDSNGGAGVIVEDVPIGGRFSQPRSWVGFSISFQHPHADVYPHFVRGDATLNGGLGAGITANHSFHGRQALQISRRSNRWNPLTDTPLLKMQKVIRWLETQ